MPIQMGPEAWARGLREAPNKGAHACVSVVGGRANGWWCGSGVCGPTEMIISGFLSGLGAPCGSFHVRIVPVSMAEKSSLKLMLNRHSDSPL